MSLIKKLQLKKQRRKLRTRRSIKNVALLPRIAVFRSAKHIYAQIIDDANRVTMVSSSTCELTDLVGDKTSKAHAVGLALAHKAKEKGIAQAVFDRGSFLYHGRVKSLAEGLREGGLEI